MSSQLSPGSIYDECLDDEGGIKKQRHSPSTAMDQHETIEEEDPRKEVSTFIMNNPKTIQSISERIQKFHDLWETESSSYEFSFNDQDSNIKSIRECDLNVTKIFGRGAFADVHQAYIKDNSDQVYAIKRLRHSVLMDSDTLEISTTDLAFETSILSSLRHENIISLLGIKKGNTIDLLRNGNFFLALEPLVETLNDRLKKWNKQWKRSILCNTLNANTVIERLETVAIGIVSAMEYLHSNCIIYRDMKPLNIGFTELNNEVKIFDFGFARLCENKDSDSRKKDHLMTGGIGTPRYMAPEVVRHDATYSFPVDVYSFSIMLWQLVTNRTPFKGIKSASMLAAKVSMGNKRPNPNFVESEALRELIKSGWSANPADRPTFSEIQKRLKRIISDHHLSLSLSKIPGRRRLSRRFTVASSLSSTDSTYSKRTRQLSAPSFFHATQIEHVLGRIIQFFHLKKSRNTLGKAENLPHNIVSDKTKHFINNQLKDGTNDMDVIAFSSLDDKIDYEVKLKDNSEHSFTLPDDIGVPSLVDYKESITTMAENSKSTLSIDYTTDDGDNDENSPQFRSMDPKIRGAFAFFERTGWKTKKMNTMNL